MTTTKKKSAAGSDGVWHYGLQSMTVKSTGGRRRGVHIDVDSRHRQQGMAKHGRPVSLQSWPAARDHQGNQAAGGSSDKFARLLHQFHATACRWTRANEAGRNLDN